MKNVFHSPLLSPFLSLPCFKVIITLCFHLFYFLFISQCFPQLTLSTVFSKTIEQFLIKLAQKTSCLGTFKDDVSNTLLNEKSVSTI